MHGQCQLYEVASGVLRRRENGLSVLVCAEGAVAFDMEKQSVPEAGLLDEPVRALTERLRQLLEDWPEHPILTQLLNLCDRLTGEYPLCIAAMYLARFMYSW